MVSALCITCFKPSRSAAGQHARPQTLWSSWPPQKTQCQILSTSDLELLNSSENGKNKTCGSSWSQTSLADMPHQQTHLIPRLCRAHQDVSVLQTQAPRSRWILTFMSSILGLQLKNWISNSWMILFAQSPQGGYQWLCLRWGQIAGHHPMFQCDGKEVGRVQLLGFGGDAGPVTKC